MCPGLFVSETLGRTSGWLEERGKFVGVDLKKAWPHADRFEVAGAYPSANGAIRDVAVVRGLLQADQFRATTFPARDGCTSGHTETAFAVSERPNRTRFWQVCRA
jgi:hypothetical protein